MKGVNLVVILGRIGADPELKNLSNGSSVVSFNVATSEVWTDREGQKQEKTEWHRIVAWGKLAEVCSKYLQKGSEVHIQGKLRNRKWEDKNGETRYITEIVATQVQFVGSKKDKSSSSKDTGNDFGPEQDMDHEPDFSMDEDIPY